MSTEDAPRVITGGGREPCPACGVEVEHATCEEREFEDGLVRAVVVTDPGTSWAHIRDAHPDIWASMVEARRKMNANPFIGGMPRKVDGTIMSADEDVADIAERIAAP